MRFPNILTALCTEPWPILPAAHARLCEIVNDHITGSAHVNGGRLELFEKALAEATAAENRIIGRIAGEDEKAPKLYRQVGNIGVIMMHGVVMKYAGLFEKMSGALDVDDISDALDAALSDDSVEGIMLHINSPGGTVVGVPETAAKIAQVTDTKPVVAYTDDLMASAAYWLASGATEIVATKSAEVGSIGVYMSFLDSSRQFEMEGLKTELLKVGKFKAAGIKGTSLSDEQRALLQARVDEEYDWFVEAVMNTRDVPLEAMEGQIFYGVGALDSGLIDKVGDFGDAMTELQELIELRKGK